MREIAKGLLLRSVGLGLCFDLSVPGLGFQELLVSGRRVLKQVQELQGPRKSQHYG